MNSLNVLLNRFVSWMKEQDGSSRPERLSGPQGTVRFSYPATDDLGRPYVLVDVSLPRDCRAEVEEDSWGDLDGLCFYPEQFIQPSVFDGIQTLLWHGTRPPRPY